MKKFFLSLLLMSFCSANYAETCLDPKQLTQLVDNDFNLECSLPDFGHSNPADEKACLWQFDGSSAAKIFLQKNKTPAFAGAQWSINKGVTCQYKADEESLFKIKQKDPKSYKEDDFSNSWNCNKDTNSCECNNADIEVCHFPH